MFERPVIWTKLSNRIDSTWLSAADCVWDGPQWLKSKQCLNLEFYRELEHLFKWSLKTPDASQKNVVDDLFMLKSHSGVENSFKSHATPYTRPNIKPAVVPYQVTLLEEGGITMRLQSINAMGPFREQSFEVKESCP